MRKSLFILIFCTMCVSVFSQSMMVAKQHYQQFLQLRASGNNANQVYDELYKCYKEYVEILDVATVGSADYTNAKIMLLELHPLLQNGAAYYSNRNGLPQALRLAQAYVDIPLLPAFRTDKLDHDDKYTTMVYFVAANSYNTKDYKTAVKYLRLYIDTGASKNNKEVYTSLAQAYMTMKNLDMASKTLEEAIYNYPNDFVMLSMLINICIERKDNTKLQKYVTQALTIQPANKTLLNIQGKLYEDTYEFEKALHVYRRMLETNPNSLDITQHVALNNYNLGVMNYNQASLADNASIAKQYDEQSKTYFAVATPLLRQIIANDPTNIKYVQALAVVYSCLGDEQQLAQINNKLSQLGKNIVAKNAMPTLIAYADKSAKPGANSQQTTNTTKQKEWPTVDKDAMEDIPQFSTFAKEYVETRLRQWQQKDSYETVREYQQRVNEKTRNEKVAELKRMAEAKYITDYTKNITFNNMTLKPYDAENRVFLVESSFGELIVPVPRERNEAKIFESSWNGMEFKNPEFYINKDRLTLAGLTFVTPSGNSYRSDRDKNLNYVETVVDVSFDAIDKDMFASVGTPESAAHLNASHVKKQLVKVGNIKSDVDINIPESKRINAKTFAVIICNENYRMVAPVPMVLNDGIIFSEYCKKTLGLPEKNVRLYKDASYGVMIRAMRDIKNIADAYSGDIQVIFYYAGHGIPNESTKDAFLLPIDADGMQTDGCYSLNRLSNELGSLNARSVVVFLDACFSGASREDKMLASARGVALTPKKEQPKGNMVIISAASNDETAFSYIEKQHGLFTYFLLKKLQESGGNATLEELSEYIIQNVKQQSVVVNRKVQTPNVTSSNIMTDEWKNIQLNGK